MVANFSKTLKVILNTYANYNKQIVVCDAVQN